MCKFSYFFIKNCQNLVDYTVVIWILPITFRALDFTRVDAFSGCCREGSHGTRLSRRAFQRIFTRGKFVLIAE